MNLADHRREYALHTFNETDANPDALEQFKQWMQDAIDSGIKEPNAMTLATATPDGKSSARIVLLKGIQNNAFVFASNYKSYKGHQIDANAYVALCFFWHDLERQVRVEGEAIKLSEQESNDIFNVRPRESQIGAWASAQSETLSGREELEARFKEMEARYAGKEIPKPPHWGGYAVRPTIIEFWQGRISRLHDRLRYSLQTDGQWLIERLAP